MNCATGPQKLILVLASAIAGLYGCDGETPTGYVDTGVVQPDAGVDLKKLPPDAALPDTVPSKLVPGIVGQHSAVSAKGGTVMVSAYERAFGDLVLLSAQATSLGKYTIQIIDGVPGTKPTKDPQGYRGGVEAKGDDVGLHTDLVITATGTPQVVYTDKTNNAVKFASRTADQWARHQLAKAVGAKETMGLHNSMALIQGKPAVAFLVLGVKGTGGTFKAELRLAQATVFTPKSSTDWTFSNIESTVMPCRNLCDKSGGEVCAADKSGASSCAKPTTNCTPKCGTGLVCMAGTCLTELKDDTVQDIPKVVGLWPALVETKGLPTVFYHDNQGGNLKAATLQGSTWKKVVVKGSKTDNVGAFPSAVVDKAGTVHVSYQDMLKASVHYVQVDPSLKATVTELIDDGKRKNGIHMVGADSAISVDPAGVVRVVYQDQQTSDLLYAKRSGPGKWTPNNSGDANLGRMLKGGPKGYGFFSDLDVDGGKVYGSTFFYHPKTSPGGGLELFTVP